MALTYEQQELIRINGPHARHVGEAFPATSASPADLTEVAFLALVEAVVRYGNEREFLDLAIPLVWRRVAEADIAHRERRWRGRGDRLPSQPPREQAQDGAPTVEVRRAFQAEGCPDTNPARACDVAPDRAVRAAGRAARALSGANHAPSSGSP